MRVRSVPREEVWTSAGVQGAWVGESFLTKFPNVLLRREQEAGRLPVYGAPFCDACACPSAACELCALLRRVDCAPFCGM